MPTTVPNQKVIQIHRKPLGGGFLGISNDNWKRAARDLGAHAFMLYIYFASNKDGYISALSPAAIQLEIGMPRSTYHDQLLKLESKGYLVRPETGKNVYHFYEVPYSDTRISCAGGAADGNNPNVVNSCSAKEQESPQNSIEINNQRVQKETNIPEE